MLSILLYRYEVLAAAQLHRLEVLHRGCLGQILGLRRRNQVEDRDMLLRCGKVLGEDKPLGNIAKRRWWYLWWLVT